MLGQQRTAFDRWLVFQGDKSEFSPHDFMWLIDWRSYDLPYCSLYIITPDNQWPCKVGISVNPEKRIMALQTAAWRPLSVARCFCCKNLREAKSLENKVHQMLSEMSRWLHGEWFDMRPNEAADIVMFCASVIGVECSDKIEDEGVLADLTSIIQTTKVDNYHQQRRIEAKALAGMKS